MSVRLRALARSNDAAAEAAAAEELLRGGSAIDAVLAGYFAAAGLYPGVLLGAVTLLLGGTGSGDRAFDGRVRQPGKNAKRPRGSLPGQTPPQTSRVGVPYSVPALAVALGYGAQSTLARLVAPGVAAARGLGAERRAGVLSRVGEVGALAFSEAEVSLALVRAFGPPSGGQLTLSDFSHPEGVDVSAAHLERPDTSWLVAPWAAQSGERHVRGAYVGCVDVKGLFAVLSFDCQPEGLPLDELELSVPLLAAPTLRGVARVAPGTPLPTPAPIWINRADAGQELWAAPLGAQPGAEGALSFGIRRNTSTRTVEAVDA